jgi:hypothetical protein
MAGNLTFLLAGIPETERVARCRELRALALVYLGVAHPCTVARPRYRRPVGIMVAGLHALGLDPPEGFDLL